MNDFRFPVVIPMLSYEDVSKASEWIRKAFGFIELERFSDPDGTVTHSTLKLNDGIVMLGFPGGDYHSPRHHSQVCDHAAKWLSVPFVVDGVLVLVDDVDSHYAQAKAAGAVILSEPEDSDVAGRRYRAEDIEGHRWMFSQR